MSMFVHVRVGSSRGVVALAGKMLAAAEGRVTGIACLEKRICCWVTDADLPAENVASPSKGLY